MSLGFVAATPSDGPAGRLELCVRRAAIRTVPEHTSFNGVLRLMKPHYLDETGQATYIVVNPGGAYFPETYDLEVRVRDRAALLLATQGATRIHRTPTAPALQDMRITVEGTGRLEYVPDSVIAYAEARYRQFTSLAVSPSATAFVGEIITPGWHPAGQPFSFADLHLRTEVHVIADAGTATTPGNLVCVDNLRLTPPTMAEDLPTVGHLEGHSHLGSVLVIGAHADAAYADRVREVTEPLAGGAHVGVTAGERHGVRWVIMRALADSTDALRSLCAAINSLDRQCTTGQRPLDLRRY